jgi:hypothetical protein
LAFDHDDVGPWRGYRNLLAAENRGGTGCDTCGDVGAYAVM